MTMSTTYTRRTKDQLAARVAQCVGALLQPIEPHEWRMANGLGNAVIDAAASPGAGGRQSLEIDDFVHGTPRIRPRSAGLGGLPSKA